MAVQTGDQKQRELGALLSLHSKEEVAHATPYVLIKLGLVEGCPAELAELLLKVAIIAGLSPNNSAEDQEKAIEAFYKKYPPNKELVDELMRILRDPSMSNQGALKTLGLQAETFAPQPLDKSKQVAGGALGRFAAGALFDKNHKKS